MKLAVFDIDGTLTHTAGVTDTLFMRAVSDVLGVDSVSGDWSSYPHVTDSGILDHLFAEHRGRNPQEHEIRSIRTRYIELLRAECPMADEISGATRALREIGAASDWRVAIATGNWFEPACHKLTICGIPFAGIPMATADDSNDRREILSMAIDRAGSSTRVVYLGDRPWDAAAAAALSVGFVAVGNHVPGAKLRLADYGDLPALWRALEEAATMSQCATLESTD
jgi:phosphoglycolate phosphatase-like HAD superfamily hydrolase